MVPGTTRWFPSFGQFTFQGEQRIVISNIMGLIPKIVSSGTDHHRMDICCASTSLARGQVSHRGPKWSVLSVQTQSVRPSRARFQISSFCLFTTTSLKNTYGTRSILGRDSGRLLEMCCTSTPLCPESRSPSFLRFWQQRKPA